MNVVPDTSAVIDGRVSERVESGAYEDATVYVPEAVVGELEAQANDGRDTGWEGLEELQRLAELDDSGTIRVEYVGERPDATERYASAEGELDAIIRDVAAEYDATLLTSDVVQSEVAEAKGIGVEYVAPEGRGVTRLGIEDFFDEETMSIHLRVGSPAMAKRGTVGEVRYETIGEEPITEGECKEWAQEIEAGARGDPEGFIELDEPGMTIVQYGAYRIAIARPPFADAMEITAVRPIVQTDMDDYAHADELRERLLDHRRGVLISGAPGAGKSTFAQAVAEFLADSGFAVKTMEKPRDLQVGPEITQYTALDGSMAATADSLLMVRPDYTIYDEVRKTDDFEVFADMRMAGVGMVGVVHATRAIDALQRLVGRVELGMIPQVADTVVYIEAGDVETVYDVVTEVKVPTGLMEEDLARPVIVVRDFETGRPAYEIYTFNRQVVTVPVDDAAASSDGGVQALASGEIEREIRKAADGPVEVQVSGRDSATVYVAEDDISQVIGKGGGRITDIENRLGVSIDVRTFEEKPGGAGQTSTGGPGGRGGAGPSGATASNGSAPAGNVVRPELSGRHVTIPVEGHAGETVEVQADGEYLFTATVSRGGEIQVSRGSAIADELERAIDRKRTITVLPS
jgi:ATPase